MAYNDSGEIPVSQSTYSLGGYTFELKVQNVHEPGEEEVVSVFAICRGPDGTRETQAIDFPAGIDVESWTVEANETEATVYVTINSDERTIIPSTQLNYFEDWWVSRDHCRTEHRLSNTVYYAASEHIAICASSSPFEDHFKYVYIVSGEGTRPSNEYAKNGKTVYYIGDVFSVDVIAKPTTGATEDQLSNGAEAAWSLVYDIPIKDGDYLVGRFAIDIREADPEDWDEPGDTGDPSYTLNVYVTGASAGTHNSNNIPLDGEMQSVYGSGGNGGNGGGGGAGASTVIIYEFATDKAGSVNQEAYAREAGAGGPGGPGGRGADGCIIIFY